MSAGPSTSANPYTFADLSMSADPSMSVGLIVSLLSAGLLLLVVLNMTKLFYIGKPVTSANNITITKTLKDII